LIISLISVFVRGLLITFSLAMPWTRASIHISAQGFIRCETCLPPSLP
jgi:hypothetical protein